MRDFIADKVRKLALEFAWKITAHCSGQTCVGSLLYGWLKSIDVWEKML